MCDGRSRNSDSRRLQCPYATPEGWAAAFNAHVEGGCNYSVQTRYALCGTDAAVEIAR
jgi:hypothetical protein